MTDFKASLKAWTDEKFPCTPPCDSFGICDNCAEAKLARYGARWAHKFTLDSAVVREMVDALKNYRTYTIATARPEYVDELIAPMNKALAAYDQARESTLKGSKEAGVE